MLCLASMGDRDQRLDDAIEHALWLDRLPPAPARPPLTGDVDVDVAVVGGGFSGLWTAYELARRDPTMRIVVLERETCGFGASGRNGGWVVGELAGSTEAYAARSSISEALRLERAIADTVDEIGRVVTAERIDCGFAKGGNVRVARTAPQARRQREEVDQARRHGFDEEHIRLLSESEARSRLDATGVRSGIFFGPCAAVDPAALVRGLTDAVERRGVVVHERTPVESIDGRRVVCPGGTVNAEVVVRATEAYTRDLPGRRRDLLPVYSLMIATEPLDDDRYADIGLADRETFSDDRRNVIYGQRTADGRLAFGSQGSRPYRFGSVIDPATELHLAAHRDIHRVLVDLLPRLDDVAITHRWGGVLAIPRDWLPSVRYDRASGQASLGGYVGEGVAAANLAGRTLADLVVGADSDLTSLPWVDLAHRRWEPEPLRWLGVRTSRLLLRAADRREQHTDRDDRFAGRLAGLLRDGWKRSVPPRDVGD